MEVTPPGANGSQDVLSTSPKLQVANRFKKAFKLARATSDSFKNFDADLLEELVAIRHKFDPVKEIFVQDEVKVRVEKDETKFALPGATREVFRMKLFSKLRGYDNYVAKRYRPHVEATRDMYFTDVKMQMLAKKMADDFNKLKPPHRIDFLEAFVLEVGSELFCAEKFVQGEYEKHNGNNGFVEEVHHRMTPHAFSHFTYMMSGGKRIIVDIQGVGDIWTDPQIHCADEHEDFGIGNMGLSGMAKFFRTYRYNPLCEWLGMTPFAQSPHVESPAIDWAQAAHSWRLSDLAKKPNPKRMDIQRKCKKLGGDIHFQTAKMYENGQFNEEPDLDSAFFHMQAAADLGYRQAHVVMAKLYSGIARDVLREYKVDEDPDTAFHHWHEAAKAGDPPAMKMVAEYFEGMLSAPSVEVSWKTGMKWYQQLVDIHYNMDESEIDEEEDFEMHKILAKMASMYETGGTGLTKSARKAAELYNDAAAAAEEHMKAKLAAKYYDKAAELEGEAEEEDSTTSELTSGSGLLETMDDLSIGASTPTTPKTHIGSGWSEAALINLIDKFVVMLKETSMTSGLGVEAAEKEKLETFLHAYQDYKHTFDDNMLLAEGLQTWSLICYDKPACAVREDLRKEHVNYIKSKAGNVKMAGTLKNSHGDAIGTQFILQFTKEDAETFMSEDPYAAAGLYKDVSLVEWDIEWNAITVQLAAERAASG